MKNFAVVAISGLIIIAIFNVSIARGFYTNENFHSTPHSAPAWFTPDSNGGFHGETLSGSVFTQRPITNSLGIRLHKFQIDDAFFYVSDRGIIYAQSDVVALSMYLTRIL